MVVVFEGKGLEPPLIQVPVTDADDLRELHHGHLAAISYVDAQVGRVLDELDALGLRKETVIIFWSDHGLPLGEHGLMRKTTVFENSTPASR